MTKQHGTMYNMRRPAHTTYVFTHDTTHGTQVKALMKFDTNNDNTLSFDEFARAVENSESMISVYWSSAFDS